MNYLKGFYSYNGFNTPEFLAEDFADLMENVHVSHNMAGGSFSATDSFQFHVNDLMDWLEIESYNDVTADYIEDFEGLLFDCGIWWNPTRYELEEFNVSKGLDKSDYIGGLFDGKEAV